MQIKIFSEEQKKQLKERSWKLKLRDFILSLIILLMIGWLAHIFVMWMYEIDENASFPLANIIGVILAILSILTAMIKFR